MRHTIRARVDLAEGQFANRAVTIVVLERDDITPADEREIEQIAKLHGRRL